MSAAAARRPAPPALYGAGLLIGFALALWVANDPLAAVGAGLLLALVLARPGLTALVALIVAAFLGASASPGWTVAGVAILVALAWVLTSPPEGALGTRVDLVRAWGLLRTPVLVVTCVAVPILAVLLSAVSPTAALLTVAVLALVRVLTLTPADAFRRAGARVWRFAAPLLLALSVVFGVAVAVAAIALYPGTAILALVLGAIALLAVRAPLAAVISALILFGSVGPVKVLLTGESTPGGIGADVFGAAAVDLALLIAVVPLLWHDRLNSPRVIWNASTRLEKIVLALLPVWLVLSVLQILQVGINQGAYGFRLAQSYALLALAGIAISARFDPRRIARALLFVGGLIAGYAVIRVVTGLLPSEQAYAISRSPDFAYGTMFRAIGSAESAPALASLLTPIFAFAVALGLTSERYRLAAWATAGTALAACIFTFTRISVLAMIAAAGITTLIWLLTGSPSRRRVVVTLICGVAFLAAVAGAVILQGSRTPHSSARVEGFVNPAGDASIRERLRTWDRVFGAFEEQPLGQGVGSVGSAAARAGATRANGGIPVADSSFLKVLVEQGVIGAPFFFAGIFGICFLILLRLRRAPPAGRGLMLASLAGFGAFVMLWSVGEYIEQPGKAIAWVLLGIALGEAYRPSLNQARKHPLSDQVPAHREA